MDDTNKGNISLNLRQVITFRLISLVKLSKNLDFQYVTNQATLNLQNELMTCVENVLNRVTDDIFIQIYKDCYKGFEKRDDVSRCSLSGSSAEARKYRKQLNTLVKGSLSETVHDTLLTKLDSELKELEELKEEQTDDTACKW